MHINIVSLLKIFGVVFFPALFILLLHFWDKEAFMRRWNAFRGKGE